MQPRGDIATLDHRAFDAAGLAERRQGTSVSVVIPARDEQATVGRVVEQVRVALMEQVALVDELVVVDDGSLDDTAALADKAGANVVRLEPRDPSSPLGKGNAMAAGLAATTGDLVVFVDADVTNFAPHFVTGLLGPLLVDERVQLVKGFYVRPIADSPTGGGRVTELVARPLLSLLFPDLAAVRQPLAGETAARRGALEALSFEPGYGVEIGLLLDVYGAYGLGAIAQVDLGERRHRNRPLEQLAPQARAVLVAALARARG